jgi:hypothetical protein
LLLDGAAGTDIKWIFVDIFFILPPVSLVRLMLKEPCGNSVSPARSWLYQMPAIAEQLALAQHTS